jgi:hypothetical protein
MARVSLQVAIKIIDMTEIRAEHVIRNQDREKEEEREREAHILERLAHPNIEFSMKQCGQLITHAI